MFFGNGGTSGGKESKKRQSGTKVGHALGHFLSVREAAEKLGISSKTVTRWCESGKLPAVAKAYGRKASYVISAGDIELLLLQSHGAEKAGSLAQKKVIKSHRDYVAAWHDAMAQGLMDGRAFSSHTVKAYSYRVDAFLSKYPVVTVEALKEALAAVPVDSVAVRAKLYKAVVCFSKFLIRESALDEEFVVHAKPLAPKYHKPPKRYTVPAEELAVLLTACETPLEWVLLNLLAHTGLRASELCALTLADLDLKKSSLTVQCGKGGKQRRLGLGKAPMDALCLYLAKCPPHSAMAPLFLNIDGRVLNRYNLYQLLQRIGERANVRVSPHALRRAFVTINANKGRPLQMLQLACGHSKITTTMSYCQTSEQEVIDAMKNWD